jgi:hypothetical protein
MSVDAKRWHLKKAVDALVFAMYEYRLAEHEQTGDEELLLEAAKWYKLWQERIRQPKAGMFDIPVSSEI